MDKVVFYEEDSTFNLTINGQIIPFLYCPSRAGIWPDMEEKDFDVILLNNPFLHKETDYFEVRFDGSEERGGFLFPITLLESEEITNTRLLSYMFISYKILLRKITVIPTTEILSDNYPDAYILTIHKPTKSDFQFHDYALSLAYFGFYKYNGKAASRFPKLSCIENQTKIIHLEKAGVDNLQNGYVKDLVFDRLCLTSDFLTRFVLVYQIVELYISEIHQKLLDKRIEEYKNGELKRNDFSEQLKEISKEAIQIKELVKDFFEKEESRKYIQDVLGLFNDIDYKAKHESLDVLLYALRNQLFHNYGMFAGHEETLNQVLFSFERVILMLLSKKLIVNNS